MSDFIVRFHGIELPKEQQDRIQAGDPKDGAGGSQFLGAAQLWRNVTTARTFPGCCAIGRLIAGAASGSARRGSWMRPRTRPTGTLTVVQERREQKLRAGVPHPRQRECGTLRGYADISRP